MQLTNQKRETIRKWSEVFAPFLSASARPKSGGHRFYDEGDLEVMLTIKEMRSRNITFDEITLALANNERTGTIEPPKTLAVNHEEQFALLQSTVLSLQAEINKRDGHIERLESQLNAALEKIDKLNRLIGKLEG